MENIKIDMNAHAIIAKCNKCNVQKEIPPEKSITKLLKNIEMFKEEHKDCLT